MLSRIGWLAVVLSIIGWTVWCNTGERRLTSTTEWMIDEKCYAISECRVDGDELKCWIVDAQDTIQLYAFDNDVPTWDEIGLVCEDIAIAKRRQRI